MPHSRTSIHRHCLVIGIKLAPLIALSFSPPAQAVPTTFDGLIQVAPPYQTTVAIQNNLFDRQNYALAGASVKLDPWVWDAQAKKWIYVVAPGETWDWMWRDLRTSQIIGVSSISYIGGEGYCWSNGYCGTVGGWWAAIGLKCMPEADRYSVEVYHNNNYLGSDSFRPTRFVPKIASMDMPASIEPKRTSAGTGGIAEIGVTVMDDIGCGQTIQNARVKLAATVVGGTNGQTYFHEGDIGTGRFSSLGYNSTLNPGGAQENYTVIAGDSDNSGLFKTRYQAQNHGADEWLRFDVERPATDNDPRVVGQYTLAPLRIAIPDLVELTHDDAPLAFRDGGSCPHDPKPHWLTKNSRRQITYLANFYNTQTGRVLSFNDASLPYGGVIANKGANTGGGGRNADCHITHRYGVHIDVNEVDRLPGNPGQEPEGVNIRTTTISYRGENWTLLNFTTHVVGLLGGSREPETPIHYRFSN